MSGAQLDLGHMPLAAVAAEIRNQLHRSGTVELAHLQRLLGDNRKSVDLQTQADLQVSNLVPTMAQMKCPPSGPMALPGV